jgi:hypothetical protein
MRNLRQLLIAIDRHAVGDVMQVNILRGTDKVEAKITVQERADDPNRFIDMVGIAVFTRPVELSKQSMVPHAQRLLPRCPEQ